MKKHRGIGVPTAIALCTILLIISLGVGSSIVMGAAMNRVANVRADNQVVFRSSTNEFIEAGFGVTVDEISDTTFTWEIYPGTGSQKALVAVSASKIRFYAVYDYAASDLLAYQSSNLYYTVNAESHYVLGGLVEYTGSAKI